MSDVTVQEAKEGLESIGMWMDARYNSRFVGTPIQTWDMPRKEKEFFTVYAMNLMVESDGFNALIDQESVDVDAFVGLLHRLGAKNTSDYVRTTVTNLRSMHPKSSSQDDNDDEDDPAIEYYDLFEDEQVWVKLLNHLGRSIYVSYLLRAQAIDAAGQNIFDPKQWQGELPKKKWWEVWR